MNAAAAGRQQRLVLIVDEQRARVQVIVALLPGLQALGVIAVAVQHAYLRAVQLLPTSPW